MTETEALARIAALCEKWPEYGDEYAQEFVGILRTILADVTPSVGLTAEEAKAVVQMFRIITLGVGSSSMLPGTAALVARLESVL
jgi:hypothetical protein